VNPVEVRRLKQEWRDRLRASQVNRSGEARSRDSTQLCQRLADLPDWRRARQVLLFAPMTTEPDLWPMVNHALREGKVVALPRFVSRACGYEVARLRDVAADLVTGHFNLREPAPSCPVLDLNQLDLALVPGLAFSSAGCRLGRGKGYYDKLLASFGGVRGGIGWDEQVVDALPTEPHDVRLDWILTPTRHWVIGSRGVLE
jgi:5-formyltetrahydrofolate cyclo-ligase